VEITKESIVRTTGGLVQGGREDGFEHWRGIPYAAPPVGPWRFRAPAPVKPWEGTLLATQYGAAPWPTEFSRSFALGTPRTTKSEDCLTVNVTRAAGPDAGRPVIVYLYGGGNRIGSASVYPGAPLIGGSDAVFVTFNFRIGVLGFLDLAGLDAGGGFDSNLALRDQLAALTWVQQNIAAFGGDPGNVTIYGESAGALAVTTLLAVPAAAGLFARAAAASSPAFHVYSRERSRAWARRYLQLLDLDPADLEDIRDMPVDRLLAAATIFDKATQRDDPGTISVSYVVDGELLRQSPIDAIRAGRGHRVPLLIGTCRDEHKLFQKILKGELAVNYDDLCRLFARSGDDVLDRVLAAYGGPGDTAQHPRIGGDAAFWYPSVALAEAHSAVAPTRMFRIDHAPRICGLTGLGPTHGADVALLFGGLDKVERWLGAARRDRAFVDHLRADLIAFARHGETASEWPLYEPGRRTTLVYTQTTALIDDPHADRRAAWTGFIGYS
jgi:para-nitrobenzyl esterase